ncbi:MAG TPA: decaprenyl-phosphate phosphoribosyltransferase, partial [Isosphaeraceae bacterium]|nr:decaprenyl-phosphate phosphoribosyltransferase [Isosphaeraceae bacterium]
AHRLLSPQPPTTTTTEEPTHTPSTIVLLLRVMRPHQWIKNLTCFAGLIFAGRLFWPDMQVRALLAFITFSLTASAVYILNDLLDRSRDRLNPRTANRPLASGQLSVPIAVATMLLLLTLGCSGAYRLGMICLEILIAYTILNIFYSIRLKKTVIADVMCIAIGFVLRVLYGVYAVNVPPSSWIILCMFFLALFLGFGKRRGEIDSLQLNAASSRPVLQKYASHYLDLAITITATLSIICYVLYCLAPQRSPAMIITVLPVAYCILRYAYQIVVECRGQSPERLLYTDKMLWIGIIAWVAFTIAVMYGNLQFQLEH